MRWLSSVILVCVTALSAVAQTYTFDGAGVEYQLDLPAKQWRAVPRLDVHQHYDFAFKDADVYLRIRKYLVTSDTRPAGLFQQEETSKLSLLPGYVRCGSCPAEKFKGHYDGEVFAYEYTSGGRAMAGRLYYLQVDACSFYGLHFTGERAQLRRISEQMDFIARSFRLK